MVGWTVLLTGLIASPQIMATWRYLPKSIRHGKTYQDKARFGSLSLERLLMGLVSPRLHDKPDGVYYPEATCYIGIVGLILALSCRSLGLWLVVLALVLLSMGRRFLFFRLVHRLCLRIPARFLYFLGVVLTLMALSTLSTVSTEKGFLSHTLTFPKETTTATNLLILLTLLQIWDLVSNSSRLVPMEPYIQRWERPSRAYTTPVVSYLASVKSTGRVSGLSYPNSTGHIHHIRTLGYNGGFQTKTMAYFRGDKNHDGSGMVDWFGLREDCRDLDWYGVKYAYTYRRLMLPKWRAIPIPHLYENTQVYSIPGEL